MNDDLQLVEPDREQVMGLDQFQPLVHHRGAIDADLGAHIPIGMRDRLRRRGGAHLRRATVLRNGPPLAVSVILRT